MKIQRKNENEILALRIALILAKQEAKKLKDTDDGGTCNLDLPVLILKQWHSSDINEAFKNTGLWASIEGDYVYICGAVDGLNLKVVPDLHADNIFLYLKELLQCKNLLIARNKMKFLAPEEKPMRETRADKTYNFSTRDGVRGFLQDYKQWDYLHYDPFLRATYRYGFKNGMYLFACETQVFCGKDKPQDEAEMQVTYFLNAQNMKSCAQISKRQLEQFCALHKDEL